MALRSAFSPTIRGRDAELAVLGELLDRVCSGSGAVLLIEGAAGMGKSRLISEGVTMARRLSLSVGAGAAEPSESVAELAPLLRAVFDGPEPLLDRAGLRSLHAAPEQRYWQLQELQPLDEAAVAQVASDVLRAEPDESLLLMAGEAGGNPFLLAELLEGLRQEGLVRVESGRAVLIAHRLPDRFRASMQERLARLSDSARQLATVSGSLGRMFSFSHLAAMLGVPPASLLKPVEELIEAGIFRERGEQLSFQHDLIREAVRHSSAASARRALDRQAADVMLAAGALPVEVALQLAGSAAPGDEVAITTLLKAAESLSTTDPGASADLSQRALELAPKKHPLRGPLVVQAAMSLHAAGRIDEAKIFADDALRHVVPVAEEAKVRLGIAGMWLVSPDVRVDASREALRLSGIPADLRVAHMAKLAYNLLVGGRIDEARTALSDAEVAGGRLDPVARFPLALSEAGLEYVSGRYARALEQFETILRDRIADADGLDELLTRLWRTAALFALDRADDALDAAEAMIADALKRGFAYFLHIAEMTRGQLLLQMGRLEGASAMLEGRVL